MKKTSYSDINTIVENQEEDEEGSNDEDYVSTSFTSMQLPSHFPYIDIKSSEELSLLDTEPNAELLVSVQPPMYRASNFLNVTKELEEEEFEDDLEDENENDLAGQLRKN